jgi:hemerythrin-like metal-binding protein
MDTTPMSYGAESSAAVDGEHQLLVSLLRTLSDALAAGASEEKVREILDQVIGFSDVHFLSEQLLMRLCSYPDYEDHVAEHDHLIRVLRSTVEDFHERRRTLMVRDAEDMLSFTLRHIVTRDRRFVEYYGEWMRRASHPDQKVPDAGI